MISPIDDSLRSIIRHGLSLQAICRKCSRKVILDPKYIAQRVDPNTSIHRLPLSCMACHTLRPEVSAYPSDWD